MLRTSLTNLLIRLPPQKTLIKGIMTGIKKIGTHNGVFHCDESLACFMIKLLPQYKDGQIIRSRDQTELDKCDIVMDVGGVYDHTKLRYDHHQASFQLTLSDIFPNKSKFGNVRLSSAGLIYAHYGHEIIARQLSLSKDDPQTDKVFDNVYEHFIKEIDAIDNGINMFDDEPRYHINTHLSARVACLKPNWNEESTPEILYDRFLQAVHLTGTEFMERIDYYGKVWMPARNIVLEAFEKRFENDPSGQIVLLPQSVPWYNHLFEIEESEQKHQENQILYVLFPDNNTWRVRAMPITPKSFTLRKALPEKWRGLRSEELCEKSGVDQCIFVHATGFIGGNHTLEGALKMAKISLKNTNIGE